MDGMITKSADISSQDHGGFSGYASTFYTLDSHGDIVDPSAYTHDLPRFLSKGFVGGSNHDHKNPIGRFADAYQDHAGLWVDVQLSGTRAAQETRQLIQDGVIQSMSVGILPITTKRMTHNEVLRYWAQAGYTPSELESLWANNGARLIKKARLLEVSPVALPANENAEIMTVKSASLKAGRRFSRDSVDTITSFMTQIQSAMQSLQGLIMGSSSVSQESDLEELGETPVIESVEEVSEASQANEPDAELINKLNSYELLLETFS
jgi:HK97 family phage prohead protease